MAAQSALQCAGNILLEKMQTVEAPSPPCTKAK